MGPRNQGRGREAGARLIIGEVFAGRLPGVFRGAGEQYRMSGDVRGGGAPIIGEVPWGAHISQFYETKRDLIGLLIPFLEKGLRGNESCTWVTSDLLGEKEALETIQTAMPDSGTCLDSGQLEVIPYNDLYMKGGAFDGKRVLQSWVDRYNEALAHGYDGIRVSGDLSWLRREDWADFAKYEGKVDKMVRDQRMLCLCTYHLDGCQASDVSDVVSHHQINVWGRAERWDTANTLWPERIGAEVLKRKKMRRTLMRLSSDADFEGRVNATLSMLANLDSKGEDVHPLVSELVQGIVDEMEAWMGFRLDSLLAGRHDVSAFADTLADIHRETWGIDGIGVVTGERGITLHVECPHHDSCATRYGKKVVYGCLPNMLMAAVLSRATGTSIKIAVDKNNDQCVTNFSRA